MLFNAEFGHYPHRYRNKNDAGGDSGRTKPESPDEAVASGWETLKEQLDKKSYEKVSEILNSTPSALIKKIIDQSVLSAEERKLANQLANPMLREALSACEGIFKEGHHYLFTSILHTIENYGAERLEREAVVHSRLINLIREVDIRTFDFQKFLPLYKKIVEAEGYSLRELPFRIESIIDHDLLNDEIFFIVEISVTEPCNTPETNLSFELPLTLNQLNAIVNHNEQTQPQENDFLVNHNVSLDESSEETPVALLFSRGILRKIENQIKIIENQEKPQFSVTRNIAYHPAQKNFTVVIATSFEYGFMLEVTFTPEQFEELMNIPKTQNYTCNNLEAGAMPIKQAIIQWSPTLSLFMSDAWDEYQQSSNHQREQTSRWNRIFESTKKRDLQLRPGSNEIKTTAIVAATQELLEIHSNQITPQFMREYLILLESEDMQDSYSDFRRQARVEPMSTIKFSIRGAQIPVRFPNMNASSPEIQCEVILPHFYISDLHKGSSDAEHPLMLPLVYSNELLNLPCVLKTNEIARIFKQRQVFFGEITPYFHIATKPREILPGHFIMRVLSGEESGRIVEVVLISSKDIERLHNAEVEDTLIITNHLDERDRTVLSSNVSITLTEECKRLIENI